MREKMEGRKRKMKLKIVADWLLCILTHPAIKALIEILADERKGGSKNGRN